MCLLLTDGVFRRAELVGAEEFGAAALSGLTGAELKRKSVMVHNLCAHGRAG